MKFKGCSIPPAHTQEDYSKDEKLTVPNRALSLGTILDRFVRNEAVAVGKNYQFGGDEDLDSPTAVDREKLLNRDIAERHEYLSMLQNITSTFAKEEKARQKKAQEAAVQKRVEELAMEKLKAETAKQNSEKSA